MPEIVASEKIKDVQIVKLQEFADERGRFIETFRKEWFPNRSWESIQGNRLESKKNVLRGLHYHHKQIDYWYVISGSIRVGLCDLRPSSSNYMATQTLDIGVVNPVGVYIPVGVAHGFLTLEDATLTYIVDNYYNAEDELGVAWDDPDINMDWGVSNPILSPRDQQNLFLKNISKKILPA